MAVSAPIAPIVQATHLIALERLGVRLERFLVVLLPLLYNAKDVPADVRRQIEAHALAHELDALVAPPRVRQEESLHT